MRHFREIIRNEQGISLVLVMGILVILGVIAVTIVVISITEMGVASHVRDSKMAFEAAEAGIDLGINQLPFSTEPFGDTLSNKAIYKSGARDTIPEAIEIKELNQVLPGFSTDYVFNDYQFSSCGRTQKAHREIEVSVRCGPLPSGTPY